MSTDLGTDKTVEHPCSGIWLSSQKCELLIRAITWKDLRSIVSSKRDLTGNTTFCAPRLVWLRGLGIVPQTERWPVWFLSGHVPGCWARLPAGGMREAMFLLHIYALSPSLSPSFHLSLKINIFKRLHMELFCLYDNLEMQN